jgi:hypothetical protein
MALDFEREATAIGADDRPSCAMSGSRSATPTSPRLFAGGPDESPMTPEEEREEMAGVVAEMRALLMVRLRHARERNPELGKDMSRRARTRTPTRRQDGDGSAR